MLRALNVRAFRAGHDRFAPARRLGALLLAVAAVCAAILPTVATALADAAWCVPTGALEANTLPPVALASDCDLEGRVIQSHGAAVTVPAPGERVAAEVMLGSGGTALLEVTHRHDGAVVVTTQDEHAVEGAAAGGGVSTQGASDCQDGAYQLSDYRDTNPHTWFFRSSTTPPGLSIGAVAQDLVDAFNAVTSSRNDCGLPDEMDSIQLYGGNTHVGSGINHLGTCPGQGDGNYTVDFGNLPEHVLARTCWRGVRTAQGWYEITEADVKIRKSASLFTGPVPGGCSGQRYSLKAVVTHEAGHTFGLRHVAERDHPELTMSERTPSCSLAPATLGLGDVHALRTAY